LLDETCFERLVDDLHHVGFTASGKAFRLKAYPGYEYAPEAEEGATAAVAIYDHKQGYGGLNNLGRVSSDGVHHFSREFIADVEIRLHVKCEVKHGSTVVHPRDVSKGMIDAVKDRVRRYWDRILIEYYGSVIDDSMQSERDFSQFSQGNTESWRLLRFQIRYEEHWTKVVEDPAGPVTAVEVSGNDGQQDAIPTTQQNEEVP